MPVLSLPGTYKDDVSVPISAADLNQLRDMAILLDGITFRRTNATNSSGPQTSGDAAAWHTRGDYRQSWWGLRYQTGMTTLTILGQCDYQLDIYLGGVFNSSQAASASFTKNITLTGYTNGEIILIEIRTNGNPATTAGYSTLFRIDDVYGSPVDVATVWGGVPTFAGTYNAARFNQLVDAIRHTWNLVAAIPIVPNVAQLYSGATHKVETIYLFDGAIGRYESGEVWRVGVDVFCQNTAEYLDIIYNGATTSFGPYTVGNTALVYTPITLTHTLGTRVSVRIQARVTDATYQTQPISKSYYSVLTNRAEAGASGYPKQTPPSAFVAEASMSAATLDTALNALATMVDTAHSRISGLASLWDRGRAFRRVFAKDDTQVARNLKRHGALLIVEGDTLICRGKGMKLGWGALTVETPGENESINYAKFSFANEQGIGKEDAIATYTLPWSAFTGIEPGMRCYLWGPIVEYVSQYIGGNEIS